MRWLPLLCFGCATAVATAQNVSERYLLQAANAERAQAGIAPIVADAQLATAARQHAAEMVRHGTISHQFAGEADLAARAGAVGAHFSRVTENVAEAQSAAQIHELWMHSPGHRANLLDPQVTAVGIAVVQDHGQLYAVEDFARAVESVPLDGQEARIEALIAAAGVAVAPATEDARRTCGMQSGFAGSRQPWFVMRWTASSLDRLPSELLNRLATGKYHEAVVGACSASSSGPFTSYSMAVLLYP